MLRPRSGNSQEPEGPLNGSASTEVASALPRGLHSPAEPDTPMSHYSTHLHEDIATPATDRGTPGYPFPSRDSSMDGGSGPSGQHDQWAGAQGGNISDGEHRGVEVGVGGSEARSRTHARNKGSESGLVGLGIAGRRGEKLPRLSLSRFGLGGRGRKNPEDVKGMSKGSRLGLSHRAWLILTIVIGFVMFSRILIPSETSSIHNHDAHSLVPRDYLNASSFDLAPFDFCPVFGPGDAIVARRGQFELLKSRLHLGTGARVQKLLQKAMSGAPVTMSVLGGSISSCVGAGEDPVSGQCYPAKFFNWWNSIFPHPANELTNGATKKTDSAYYAYCNSHHLPDKSDLVILEFDAADPNDPDWLAHFELLVRSILVRPEMPAVIILGHFSLQVQAQNGFAGPELLHNVVAQFYDVPHISVKGVMYEQYLQHPEQSRATFYHDPNHANPDGHDLIADVLISYFMSQICSGWSTIIGQSFDVPDLGIERDTAGSPTLLGGVGLRPGVPQDAGDGDSAGSNLADRYLGLRVPNARLRDRPSDVVDFREIEPFCVAASDLINPLPPSLFYGSGWKAYHPTRNAVVEDRHYWYAEQPSARLRIPLKLGAGDVGIYFLQSPPDKPLGSVKCWVDDNYGGARELHGTADVEEVIATLQLIDRHVARGSHFVECQLLGEVGTASPPFKILGVFTT